MSDPFPCLADDIADAIHREEHVLITFKQVKAIATHEEDNELITIAAQEAIATHEKDSDLITIAALEIQHEQSFLPQHDSDCSRRMATRGSKR